MKNRDWYNAVGAGLVVAIALVANMVSHYVHIRLDVSRGRIYSLSDASRKLVAGLDDPVLIKAYFSKTLPPQYEANRRYLESFLKEYAGRSRGKLRYEFIDVEGEKGEQANREAVAEGVTPVRFNIFAKEKFEVQEGLMGLVLRYEDQKEVIPFVNDISSLEYEITSRIRKMTDKKKPLLGFALAGGSSDLTLLPPEVLTQLQQNYEVRTVDLSAVKAPVEPEFKALCLLGPTSKLSDKERYLLDQFALSGRPLLLGIDTRKVDLHSFYSNSQETGIPSWLAKYGITLRPELVLDEQNEKVTVATQQGFFQIRNIVEFPPMVLSTDLNREEMVTKELQAVVLPFVSPIEISSGPLKAIPLARSSANSWYHSDQRGFMSLNPFQEFKREEKDPAGPFVLAAIARGRLESAFDKPPAEAPQEGYLKTSTQDARLIVIGTSKFIRADEGLPPVNQAFFQNLVDWMLQEPELIAIRSKSVAFTPLKNISDGKKALVRYADIFGPGLLVLVLGGARWQARRRWKQGRVRIYALT